MGQFMVEQLTSNFCFLQAHDPVFFKLALNAEANFVSDPNTTLLKLRQLGEALAQDMASRCGIVFDEGITQVDLLFKLDREIQLDPTIRQLFHTLRIEGNIATHGFKTQHKEALNGLKVARELAIWYHRSFSQNSHFKPGVFIPPVDPSQKLRDLQGQIAQLSSKLLAAHEQADNNHQMLALLQREKQEADALAEAMDEEARRFEQQTKHLESELQQQKSVFAAHLKTLQAALNEQKSKVVVLPNLSKRIRQANKQVTLDEALTRIIIDQQLQEAGWETDSQTLRYELGAWPEKGKNKAIAEWPTQGKQRADYILFTGLVPIAVVEAKRENINVAGKLTQAERYARGFRDSDGMRPA